MVRTPFYLVILLVFTGAILAACTEATPLSGATWHLVSYGSVTAPTPAVQDVETSLVFGEDSQVSGNMGCNSFSGGYEARGDQITFESLAATLMACDEPRMQQEADLFRFLSGTLQFEVKDNILTMSSTDGSFAAVFTK